MPQDIRPKLSVDTGRRLECLVPCSEAISDDLLLQNGGD